MSLAPYPVIVPLLVAAFLIATSSVLPRVVVDALSTATALAVVVLCVSLVAGSTRAPIVYWFGGWRPHHGIALGISFVIDPLGAGLAALAATLVTAAFVFSWRYFEAVRVLYHVLMLVFLAAMMGFCLTGDLFDLFVFFELLSVAAFTLTGYLVEDQGPLQGALNYAVTVSVGAFLMLNGIALLYGRTGALNLAQMGRELAGHPSDGLVIVAFVLITSGLLAKAAAVPFHFWLPDVETAAPNPVCAVFSGALVALGVYGIARVYWTVFSGVLGVHSDALRAILVAVGVLTALLGAVMCPLQRHLKRLLAFSTVAHVGLFLIGTALLTPLGLAGAAVYILGHGVVKAALFLLAGIIAHRCGSYDENHLHGRGRDMPVTRVLVVVGGLALAGLPPFGTFLGKGLIEDAAAKAGYPWLTAVLVIASICTGGAVLAAAGQVFWGWGPREEDTSSAREGEEKEPETKRQGGKVPVVMIAPTVALLLVAFALGFIPDFGHGIEVAAARFQDRPAYAAAVLNGIYRRTPIPPSLVAPDISMVLSGLGSAAGAVAFALLMLFGHRLPTPIRHAAGRPTKPVVAVLRRALQSGHIGDYITWLTLGVALFGAACAATLR